MSNWLCHCGRSNSTDTPPVEPWDSGESTHGRSPTQSPRGLVDNVVPPTVVIAGIDETASRPMSSGPGGADHASLALHSRPALSPLASNAEVPRRCALSSAAATGARSAAVTSLSQPHPIDRLHTAPGNWRSASSNILPIFSKAPSPWTVGRALTTTSRASGAIACATWRSIAVSPCCSSGFPPTITGVNRGSSEVSAKRSKSSWSALSNAKKTIVWPLPVMPCSASGSAL